MARQVLPTDAIPRVCPVPQRLAFDSHTLSTSTPPQHYNVKLIPDLTAFTFKGEVAIDVDIQESTKAITVNAASLSFDRVRVLQSSSELV